MRTATDSGSAPDVLNGLIIQLQGCADLGELEYRFPRIARILEGIRDRVAIIYRRGRSTASVAGPLDWLDQVVRDHPALQAPDGEPLRSKLLRLAEDIRRAGRL